MARGRAPLPGSEPEARSRQTRRDGESSSEAAAATPARKGDPMHDRTFESTERSPAVVLCRDCRQRVPSSRVSPCAYAKTRGVSRSRPVQGLTTDALRPRRNDRRAPVGPARCVDPAVGEIGSEAPGGLTKAFAVVSVRLSARDPQRDKTLVGRAVARRDVVDPLVKSSYTPARRAGTTVLQAAPSSKLVLGRAARLEGPASPSNCDTVVFEGRTSTESSHRLARRSFGSVSRFGSLAHVASPRSRARQLRIPVVFA